jgi:ATP-dependent helicase/DNAse subunit B
MGLVRNVPIQYQGKTIYSISRLQSFLNCQFGYYLTYVKKIRGKDNIYNFLGQHIHSLIEQYQGGLLTNQQMVTSFENKLIECDILDLGFPTEKVKDNFITCITHFLTNYNVIDAKDVNLEKEFYTEIYNKNGGEPYIFMGFIDAIIYNHDGTVEVIDYKTSTKYAKQDLDEHALQLLLYCYALEQEGIKVDKVKWNMLKYCWIKWQGATKPREMFSLRSEIVKSLRSELTKDLRKLKKEDFEIELILDEAEQLNSFSTLPQSIQDKYIIADGYIEYPYDDSTKEMLIDFVNCTIPLIESKVIAGESEWKPLEITTKNNFFCSQLCGVSGSCPYYQEFINANRDSFTKITDKVDEMSEIFG